MAGMTEICTRNPNVHGANPLLQDNPAMTLNSISVDRQLCQFILYRRMSNMILVAQQVFALKACNVVIKVLAEMMFYCELAVSITVDFCHIMSFCIIKSSGTAVGGKAVFPRYSPIAYILLPQQATLLYL